MISGRGHPQQVTIMFSFRSHQFAHGVSLFVFFALLRTQIVIISSFAIVLVARKKINDNMKRFALLRRYYYRYEPSPLLLQINALRKKRIIITICTTTRFALSNVNNQN